MVSSCCIWLCIKGINLHLVVLRIKYQVVKVTWLSHILWYDLFTLIGCNSTRAVNIKDCNVLLLDDKERIFVITSAMALSEKHETCLFIYCVFEWEHFRCLQQKRSQIITKHKKVAHYIQNGDIDLKRA